MRVFRPQQWCRVIGHRRYSLDGPNVVNVDACARCGVLLKARRARDFKYLAR